jgi:hypothetical protein
MVVVLAALLAASDPSALRALARDWYAWRDRADPDDPRDFEAVQR